MIALPTYYRGIEFRSRLEARWAVFFDWMHIRWEYEKEGYEFEGGLRYLPDFWLPKQDCWVEIKPTQPSDIEERKAAALANGSGKPVYLFYEAHTMPPDDPPGSIYFGPGGEWDIPYRWCECPDCGQLGIRFEGRSDRLPCKECYYCWDKRTPSYHEDGWYVDGVDRHPKGHLCKIRGCPRHGGNGDKGYNDQSNRLLTAYGAARDERFGT